MRQISTFAAAVLVLTSPVFGHHADTGLDMESVLAIEGAVTEFNWRNPHTYLSIESTDADGEPVEWTVQLGAAVVLSRRGVTRDTLQPGDQIVVELHPARDGQPYGLVVSIEKEGVEVVSRSRRFVRSIQQTAVSTTTLEGRWFVDRSSLVDYPGGLDELANEQLTLTEKGRVAADAFDQNSEENPLLSCTSTRPTPVGIVYTDFYPMEIEFIEDEIIMIRSQFFDQERTVYMDGRAHPQPSERFHEGHAIGWWERDVLVVDTTNFADDRSAYQNGVPSGAQKHVVERYRLGEDGTRMTVEFSVEDPEYFMGSFTHTRDLIYSPHLEMTPYNCDLESTRRFLTQ